MSVLYWLEESAIGLWVAQSWGYPLMLSGHAVGMSIVVGTVLMINFRLLGYAEAIPLNFFTRLTRITWAGVVLNTLSGLALFSGNPVKFFFHPAFWIKISLIVFGGLSLWWAMRSLQGTDTGNSALTDDSRIKFVAAISVLAWLGAIAAGRLIAYFKLF